MGKILGKSKTFQYWTFQSKSFKSWTFQSQTFESNTKMIKKVWVPHIFDRIQLYDFHMGTILGKVFLAQAQVLWFMQNCSHAEIAFSNSNCNHNVIIQYSQQKKESSDCMSTMVEYNGMQFDIFYNKESPLYIPWTQKTYKIWCIGGVLYCCKYNVLKSS